MSDYTRWTPDQGAQGAAPGYLPSPSWGCPGPAAAGSAQPRGRNTGQQLASVAAAAASWAPAGQGSGHLALEGTFDLAREASVIVNHQQRKRRQKTKYTVCVCSNKLKWLSLETKNIDTFQLSLLQNNAKYSIKELPEICTKYEKLQKICTKYEELQKIYTKYGIKKIEVKHTILKIKQYIKSK